MKKEAVGASAGWLALFALVLHTQPARQQEQPKPGHAEHAEAESGATSEKAEKQENVDGPWLATQAYFEVPSSTRRWPGSYRIRDLTRALVLPQALSAKQEAALEDLLGISAQPEVECYSVVATVADPAHSRMSLFLDGQTEAIQRAVEAQGWDFAEQWTPWFDRFDRGTKEINARRTERWLEREQEELPGILVFRGSPMNRHAPPQALFIFLVPETATAGIHGPVFYAAMHLASVLSRNPHGNRIALLAPSYSGSFPSLAQLVSEWRRQYERRNGGYGVAQVNRSIAALSPSVYGASVANDEYAGRFREETGLDFHGGVVNSHDYMAAACQLVRDYGIREQITVLKEDEGGLQRAMGKAGMCQLETYVFPRDISHLRNAYEDAIGAQPRESYSDSVPKISFSIRDSGGGEDGLPIFSGAQTPITQQTILNSITDNLNRRHTRLVFISATNTLDSLLLLRMIRASSPNTRVMIEGPNALFVAAANENPSFTGTLFLSPYPMSFTGDDWLDGSASQPRGKKKREPTERLMFSDSALEGLYNVTQLALLDICADNGKLRLRGYRQPGAEYPGVWLLTLNRFGFSPIDLRNSEQGNRWFQANPAPSGKYPPAAMEERPARSWMITVFVIAAAALAGSAVLIRCNRSGANAEPLWLVFTDRYKSRLQALLCASLALSALQWILILPWCTPLTEVWQRRGWTVSLLQIIAAAGLAAPIAALVYVVVRLRKRGVLKSAVLRSQNARAALYFGIPIFLFAAVTIGWWRLCMSGNTAIFFRLRAMELYSGSSPAPPLAVAAAALCCIYLLHLKRYALAGLARPRLEMERGENPTAFRERFIAAYNAICERVTAPWTLSTRALLHRVLAVSLFVLVCWMVIGRAAWAFEPGVYNRLLVMAVSAVLLCLAANWFDLLTTWRCVRKLLDLIQLLPMIPAIERVAKNWPRRPVWTFNRSVSKEAVDREMLYALHGRSITRKAMEEATNSSRRSMSSLAQVEEQFARFSDMVIGKVETSAEAAVAALSAERRLDEIGNYQKTSASLAAEMHDHDLRPAWRAGFTEETRGTESDPLYERYIAFCADFVALQFCRYAAYAVTHVKRLATSLSLGFVLLTLLCNSYSPEGYQIIARFLAVLFVAIGVVVWRVFSQMERNPVLSAIAHTTAGELNSEFWFQLVELGGLPLLGVVVHLFPSLGQFAFQWIAPGMQEMH